MKCFIVQRYERGLWRDVFYSYAAMAYARYNELRAKDADGYWRVVEVMEEHAGGGYDHRICTSKYGRANTRQPAIGATCRRS